MTTPHKPRSTRLARETNHPCQGDRRTIEGRNCPPDDQRDSRGRPYHRAVYELEYADVIDRVHRERYCMRCAAAMAAKFHVPFPPGPTA